MKNKPTDNCEDIKKEVISYVAEKYKVIIGDDDPILTAVYINEAVLNHYNNMLKKTLDQFKSSFLMNWLIMLSLTIINIGLIVWIIKNF